MVSLLAGYLYTQIPVPRVCGDGGLGLSNTEANISTPSEYGGVYGLSWTPGVSVSFSWTSTTGSPVTFVVLDPTFQPIYNHTGKSGSGSFTADSGSHNATYDFALPRPPPIETASVSYHCTTT
ncbi:MAG: hypothetical protein L3K23_03440 [Thermoplasmata archaeon]|nr:hypothetical protein [Thermoplasmata archaeon]